MFDPDPCSLVAVFSGHRRTWRGRDYVQAESDGGIWGLVAANNRMPNLGSLFKGLVVPAFVGKDIRRIEQRVVDEVYTDHSNYRYAGMPFWNGVARQAAAAGLLFTPHSPRTGAEALHNLQLLALVTNPGRIRNTARLRN